MKEIIAVLLISGALISGFVWLNGRNQPTNTPTGLAQCLKDKGTIFFGTFWCPHCQNQKKMFGSEADQLPYVECSTPDGKNQTTECQEKDIQSYPTWQFADGSRLTGEIALEVLAQKAGCPALSP